MASRRVLAACTAGKFSLLFVVVCAFLAAPPVLSDPIVPPETYELPVQTVIAQAQVEEPTLMAGTTIYSSEILEIVGVATLEEAISLAPSLTVSTLGASGAQSTITIRGSTSNQVLVIIDGIRVSDPATGLVDLSRIALPANELESVEMIRGGLTTLYGADAVGGVILVTTKRGSDTTKTLLRISNHSYLPAGSVSGSGAGASLVPASPLPLADGQSLYFKASLPYGLGLSASAERAANGFTYYDSNFIRRRRHNADLVRASTRLSWGGSLGEGKASGGLEFGVRSLGVPGTLDSPTPEARQRDLDASISADYSTDYFISDALAFDASVYAKLGILEYSDDPTAVKDIHRSIRTGGDSRWSLLFDEFSSLQTGLSFRYETLDSTVVQLGDGSSPQRASIGVFVAPSLVLGRWTLLPAARWDWTNDFPSGLSFSLGARKTYNEIISLAFSAATAYRAPSFDDLYWPLSNGAEGNPGLGPDLAYAADIGLDAKGMGWTLSSAAFVRYVRDVILWQENNDGIWRPTNFGDAFYPGIELEYMSTSPPWTLSVSYGFIYSYVLSGGLMLSDDKRVPGVPVHTLGAVGTYSRASLKASLSGKYEGLRYLTTANQSYQPAVFILGFGLEWSLDGQDSLFLRAENLLNERYESTRGYPMPGVSIEIGFERSVGKK